MERAAGSCHRFVGGPKKIKYFRLRRMGESCAVIMLMMLASASGVTVWIHWPPLLPVTKAGIILLSMGFMLPVLSYGRLLRLYYGLKTDCSNVDYMSNLLKIKKQEHRQQHIVLNLYFCSCRWASRSILMNIHSTTHLPGE